MKNQNNKKFMGDSSYSKETTSPKIKNTKTVPTTIPRIVQNEELSSYSEKTPPPKTTTTPKNDNTKKK